MKLNFKLDHETISEQKREEFYSKVLYKAGNKIVELAKRFVPVDTGTLKNSIKINPKSIGADEYIISDGVTYGIHVEYGTAPHFPPLEPLKGWSKRVLGDESAAYAVAKKIAEKGTPAQPFMRPAADEVRNIHVPNIWDREIAKSLKI